MTDVDPKSRLTAAPAIAAGAVATLAARSVHAAGSDAIRFALIGCGGRGTGAASQVLQTAAPTKLWAMSDLFPERIATSLDSLRKGEERRYDRAAYGPLAERIDVPPERQFAGFDAYKAAIDSGVDLVLLTAPSHFRPLHFEYAVAQGKHIFAEKAVAIDPPGVRRILAAGEAAKKRNLKVGVGLHRGHSPIYQETIRRLQDGAIGEFRFLRFYANNNSMWYVVRKPAWSEMEYQLRNWQNFNWLCGDRTCENLTHSVHIAYWLLGKPPAKANGMGGRAVPNPHRGDVFDHHAVEFTWPDGLTMFSQVRQIDNCCNSVTQHVHGTRGTAEISQGLIRGDSHWRFRGNVGNPYQLEQDDLVAAIVNDRPYNETEQGAMSTMMSILARMASYSGKVIAWDDALGADLSLAPRRYAFDADPPVLPDKSGSYEYLIPMPGVTKPR